jgi:hypothetical protein
MCVKVKVWVKLSLFSIIQGVSKRAVFCALSKDRVYTLFFFMETTITVIVYLDMLQQFLIPQLDEYDQEGRIYIQQDPLVTLEKCRVPQHLFPRSVDR